RAAKAQIRELYRFKRFVDAAEGNVTVILGNHDESALDHRYELSTRGGLKHIEFDEQQGGMALPDDLAAWFHAMPRERVFHGVQFAHAGPLPGMQVFDDFFYHDPDTKSWWYKKPELVRQAGHRFGVYGHTAMKEGVYVDRDNCFAMIDALGKLQFLELILDVDRLDYSVMQLRAPRARLLASWGTRSSRRRSPRTGACASSGRAGACSRSAASARRRWRRSSRAQASRRGSTRCS